MAFNSLPDSSLGEHGLGDNTALRERLGHLERLLETFGTAQAPDGSGGVADTRRSDALISPRLRPLTEQVERRVGSEEWDVADALAARVLLDEFKASVRGCRMIANDASARLHDTQGKLREGARVIRRELDRRRPDDPDQGSTD